MHHLNVLYYHQKKILCPRISFRVKKIYIDDKYELYSRTCAYGSSIIEGVDFTVSYTQVTGIISLHIIIGIASEEGLIIFTLYIYNALQNTILLNTKEIFYLSFTYPYLEWFKMKFTNHPLESINPKEI